MQKKSKRREDYLNVILGFLARIELDRLKKGSLALSTSELPWSNIVAARENNPLRTPTNFFEESDIDVEVLGELDSIVERLNTTEDVVVWKRAVNRLLQVLQGSSFTPLYRGKEFAPELTLEECD